MPPPVSMRGAPSCAGREPCHASLDAWWGAQSGGAGGIAPCRNTSAQPITASIGVGAYSLGGKHLPALRHSHRRNTRFDRTPAPYLRMEAPCLLGVLSVNLVYFGSFVTT